MKIKKHIISYSVGLSILLYLFPDNFQLIIAFVLILSIGLLHGANDMKIIESMSTELKGNIKFWRVAYGFSVLLILSSFFLVPALILPFFILISAYHFGEQHFEFLKSKASNNKYIRYSLFLNYGIYIFFLLFFIEFDATKSIVNDINSAWFTKKEIGIIVLLSIFVYLSSLYLYVKNTKSFIKLMRNEFIYFVVFLAIFYFSSLLVGFAIYFVFWHSLPSLRNQQDFLYSKTGFQGLVLYFIDSWRYWLISLIGLGIFWFFLKDEKNVYSVLFAFVAAITFPHVVIMHGMFKNINSVSTKKDNS